MLPVFAELLFEVHRLAEHVGDVRHPGAFPAEELRIAGELQQFLGAFADFVFRLIAEGFRHLQAASAMVGRSQGTRLQGDLAARSSLNKEITN